MKNHPIELRLSKPIPPGTYTNETRRELANHVRNEVQQLLKQN
jgi:hypothetical protein